MRDTIIIDTDPGQDDAVAILLAIAAADRLEVAGLCAVAGNVPIAQTTANTIRICDLGGSDLPVYAGAAGPLVFAPETAEFVCGPDGLAGADLPPPTRAATGEHAVDFIIRTLRTAPAGSVTLCPLGPLTNIALAFRMAPDVIARVKRIVLMGGSVTLGNMTPAAEFNFHVDPHAAHVVLGAGVPVVMFGLNATLQAICAHDQIERFAAMGNRSGAAVHGMLTRPRPGGLGDGAGHPMHDPCVIAWLLWPELFTGRDCHVEMDISDGPQRGRSTVDWNNRLKRPANAHVIDKIDARTLFDRIADEFSRLP